MTVSDGSWGTAERGEKGCSVFPECVVVVEMRAQGGELLCV